MSDNENDDLEIIAGDGSELDVSPVYDHLNELQPTAKEDEDEMQEIVIPKTKQEREEENENK